ncbi:hypothetical protein TCAL_10096 [Tigriopus californicus]|uniref:POU domain protein n=2 Tax=Tigriopus californicus TaxID=6832 RepID=A0A553P9V1_TIGCA|nr:hypothetical protein TCAL_10096 [Tigriopus californicus]|eukprot:TCALIF_10096-PA protein Name:"Similar to Pou6f1 POU domain, class 6, transcription factor 1 (Rattus norvegicus)" AED:0.38 eAED:0.38 QI:0/-1/0/1/-1/1/1/0/260
MYTVVNTSPLLAQIPHILVATQPQVVQVIMPVVLPAPGPSGSRPIQPKPSTSPVSMPMSPQSFSILTKPPDLESMGALDGVDEAELDDIREIVQSFKEKRVALGLTQAQVAEDFQAQFGQKSINQSVVCRIERLDFHLKQMKQLKPLISSWLTTADERYCYLSTSGALEPLNFNRYVLGKTVAAQKRKRQKRTKIPTQCVDLLNRHFEQDPLPNQYRLNEIAIELGMDYKTVKIWFRNKRQHSKARPDANLVDEDFYWAS